MPPPGGRINLYGDGQRGPVGPPPVCAREIGEGGIRALRGGIRGFVAARARRLVAFW